MSLLSASLLIVCSQEAENLGHILFGMRIVLGQLCRCWNAEKKTRLRLFILDFHLLTSLSSPKTLFAHYRMRFLCRHRLLDTY